MADQGSRAARQAAASNRDSHDLSLPSRDVMRDSLVSHMLLSLDQFSLAQPQPANGTARLPSYTSQHTSQHKDEEFGPCDGPGDSAVDSARATHAWGGSRLQTASDSKRRQASSSCSPRRGSGRHLSASQRAFPLRSRTTTPPPTRHRSPRNASESSESASGIDATQPAVDASSRRRHRLRRSASFDVSRQRPGKAALQPLVLNSSPFNVKFPDSFARNTNDYTEEQDASEQDDPRGDESEQEYSRGKEEDDDDDDDDDDTSYGAAPTPTVPSGPRRDRSAMSSAIAPSPLEAPESRTLNHKSSSNRLVKGVSAREKRNNRLQSPPGMAALDLDAAPAPSVGYRKSKAATEASSTPVSTPTQAKERPGFFRRVFGGGASSKSLNSSSSNQDQQRLPSSASVPDRLQRASENNKKTRQQQQQQLQPHEGHTGPAKLTLETSALARDVAAPMAQVQQQPVLQKKPSSFFRRRKKSVIDEQTPPVPSVDAPAVPSLGGFSPLKGTIRNDAAALANSPTSSLRDVMKPYLGSPNTSASAFPTSSFGAGLGLSTNPLSPSSPLAEITNTSTSPGAKASQPGYKRGFSPDYDPSPNARIRRVDAEQQGRKTRPVETPSRPAPQPPKDTSAVYDSDAKGSSFLDLEEGSDAERPGPKRSKERQQTLNKGKVVSKSSSPHGREADATIRAGTQNSLPILDKVQSEPGRAKPLPIALASIVRATSLASCPTETEFKTAPSAPPSVRVEGVRVEHSPKPLGSAGKAQDSKTLDEPDFVLGEPTEDDLQKAQKIFEGSEVFISKDKAASWMGEEGPVRQRTLQAYMKLYDFGGKSVLDALRSVCSRLVLRAETQQVDRILLAFAKRWCECNARHGFKSTDIIHTICYSIMLLNTDLHLADIDQKMTRSQFVKNTMTTIMHTVSESAPQVFVRPSILSGLGSDLGQPPADQERSTRRSSFLPRSDSWGGGGGGGEGDDCGPLVKAPFNGTVKAWQEQVETVLKNIYASIRDERLPLYGVEADKQAGPAAPQGNLSVIGMLKRSPSVLSKATSETQLSSRGRLADSSLTSASRWTSKSRSRPRGARNGFSSSRTSFEDGSSLWSPTMSSATWSRYSLGRTQGSMSQESFSTERRRGDYQQSIGFANALSQAIVRDDDTAASIRSGETLQAESLLEDESLELAGPPWIKEAIVSHKHHLDSVGKKARERNWTEVFAVIQKGHMSLFSFSSSAKSTRSKGRARGGDKPSGPVGGGNWQDNAVKVGSFSLRLTLASALPPPGYSRTRPHVWALSMPTGAVHLFQVGTADIIREFVYTANYWSARLSTHPLTGGISNVEYGWSDAVIDRDLMSAMSETPSRPDSSASRHARKSSIASSTFRAPSLDHVAASLGKSSAGWGTKLAGDRIHIAEWTPPTQSMRPSSASEPEQLAVLTRYVQGIDEELKAHNDLRGAMLLAFTPRGSNSGKAMANWERKSAYLLRESAKFQTYVECLQQAAERRREIYAERDLARRAARGELSDGDMDASDDDGHGGDDDADADEDDDDEAEGKREQGEDHVGDETLKP
ncbi:hypothetical protein CDD82_7225 [Ophiocordyceps australis]|uniref:SEC7 domain-containing protein n=1 Tax=Ophiocordyceps australis TaxID=1399860 RepID=A0A2C5YRX9_9HYPO|nr:hypothetical protein CDD82_7225 [Ophiocordyceps australis]